MIWHYLQIFITSKVGSNLPMGYNETMQQVINILVPPKYLIDFSWKVDDILEAYQSDYVDLVLIHWYYS